MKAYLILPVFAEVDDYYSRVAMINRMKQWLTDNEVQFDEMKLNHDPVPHTFLMDSIDLIAFKLKFGL